MKLYQNPLINLKNSHSELDLKPGTLKVSLSRDITTPNNCVKLCLTLRYFVLVFFSDFSIAITSLGEERANLSAFRTFVRFAVV